MSKKYQSCGDSFQACAGDLDKVNCESLQKFVI